MLVTKNEQDNEIKNIAGRLPENSRNNFVDVQSKKKQRKRQTKKNHLSIESCYFLTKNLYKFLLLLLAALK